MIKLHEDNNENNPNLIFFVYKFHLEFLHHIAYRILKLDHI